MCSFLYSFCKPTCSKNDVVVFRRRLSFEFLGVRCLLNHHLLFGFQVKQLMEEAVTKKFIHADSSSITSLCGKNYLTCILGCFLFTS